MPGYFPGCMNHRNAGWLMRSTGGVAQITVHQKCQSLILPKMSTWVVCHSILIIDDISPHFILRTLRSSNGIHTRIPKSLTIAVGALCQSFDRVSIVLVFRSVMRCHFCSANNNTDMGQHSLGVCLVASKSHTGLVILHVRKRKFE